LRFLIAVKMPMVVCWVVTLFGLGGGYYCCSEILALIYTSIGLTIQKTHWRVGRVLVVQQKCGFVAYPNLEM
jgi:hypothetical protein